MPVRGGPRPERAARRPARIDGPRARYREDRTLSAHLRPRAARFALVPAAALALVAALLTLAAAQPAGAAIGGGGAAELDASDERPYDADPYRLHERGEGTDGVLGVTGRATAAIIPFFTDCAPGEVFAGCGPSPARWIVGDAPVDFCTFQNNRAASVSAQLFRDAVEEAADAWNVAEAAVGVRYLGDCPAGFRWSEDNGVNEIGFDDGRNAVVGTQSGITMGSWLNGPSSANVQNRAFIEADIVLDERLSVPLVCFRSVIAHELGHALGFGHSDTEGDLMFPSFTPSDLATCPGGPSAEERARLQELYGVDRPPTVSIGPDRIVEAGEPLTLLATGSDPEGKPLTYEWAQLAGAPVTLAPVGAGASLVAPATPGSTLRLQVTARDPFLHRAVAFVLLTVTSADSPPLSTPSLVSFLPNASRSAAVLGWEVGADATSFEFCSSPGAIAALESCATVGAPEVEVTWDTVLGSAGPPDARRVFEGQVRDTSLAACNAAGCTGAGFGPLAGGLRWQPWAIDFDYLAFAFDVRGFRWTIAAVANLSDAPRSFVFRSGPAEDPTSRLLHGCGTLRPGDVCVGWLSPNEGPHDAVVTIVSTAAGTPTTEHRITVR